MKSHPFELALYIHIPFCLSKCGYCAFNSTTSSHHFIPLYMQHLYSHLNTFLQKHPHCIFSSLYIGGGTPNVVDAALYESLFELLQSHLCAQSEQNCEINPNSITKEWLMQMQSYGINRLSLGVQSFFSPKLDYLERDHNPQAIFETMNCISQVQIPNISIDLIYGTPLCNPKLLLEEIKLAASLPINHLSAYQLSLDEGSAFFKKQKFQEHHQAFDAHPSMGHFMRSHLHDHGFLQYEVSNYARPYQSKHNLSYWSQKPYLGIGAGAVGCIDLVRFYPPTNLRTFLFDYQERKEKLSLDDWNFESLFLGFRSQVGVPMEHVPNQQNLQTLLQSQMLYQKDQQIYAKDYFLGDEITLFLS